MYISRRRDGMSLMMSTSELFDRALGSAIKVSVREEVPVLIMEEKADSDPGMYVEREAEVMRSRERRRIFVRVTGWKIEWLS